MKILSFKMTLLVAMMLSIAMLSTVRVAEAQETSVLADPLDLVIANVGESATVNITVQNVVDLFAYEIKVWFLPAFATVTSMVRPADQFLKPVDPASEFQPKWEINNTANDTGYGYVWASYTLLAPEVGHNGTGTLFQLTFQGVAVGQSPLTIYNPPLALPTSPTKLVDPGANLIPCVTAPALINVIPEFPIALALPALAVISLSAALISKRYKRKPF